MGHFNFCSKNRPWLVFFQLWTGFLALFCLSLMAAGTNAYAKPVVIGIIGDQTGASDINRAYEIFEKGAQALKRRNPQIVFHVGDLVESRPDVFSCKPTDHVRKQITERFQKGVDILSGIGVSWYLTPGDHDVNPCPFLQNSPDLNREKLFQTLYEKFNPKVSDQLYYSLDVGDYHIISLYSQEHLHSDPRWGNVFLARLSDNQFEWLKRDLAQANDNGKKMVVFLHQPLWYNWTGWADIHELLEMYPVRAVIAGHFHYKQVEAQTGGFRYRTVGVTGDDIKQASANAGGMQHVTLLTLDEEQVFFEIIPLGESAVTAGRFMRHKYMDWNQSLDVNLGNAWAFYKDNPLFFKEKLLVNNCDGDDPATIKINKVGNPTPVPVKTDISLPQCRPGFKFEQRCLRRCNMPESATLQGLHVDSIRVD